MSTIFDKFDEIRAQVAGYIAGIDVEHAPAAEYFEAQIPGLTAGVLTNRRGAVLSSLWNDYLSASQVAAEARTKLSSIDSYWYLNKDRLSTYLTEVAAGADKQVEGIRALAANCIADETKCVYQPAVVRPPAWPAMDPAVEMNALACVPAGCDLEATIVLRIQGRGAQVHRKRPHIDSPADTANQ